jgi:hypothetical protein
MKVAVTGDAISKPTAMFTGSSGDKKVTWARAKPCMGSEVSIAYSIDHEFMEGGSIGLTAASCKAYICAGRSPLPTNNDTVVPMPLQLWGIDASGQAEYSLGGC